MTARGYGNFLLHMAKADVDFDTASLAAMLATSSYVPDFGVHEFRSDVTDEVAGTGYTAGGLALTGVAVALDAVNSWVNIAADDADFGTLTVSGIAQLIVYVDTGSSATDLLVSCHTLPAPRSVTAGNFTYKFAADGIGTFPF